MNNPSYKNLINELINTFLIDLKGLTVYTEAASGAYLLAPIIAARAGAKKVYAQTRDSRYATASEVRLLTMHAAEAYGVSDRIEIVESRCLDCLSKADIVTNSGFVRPIDANLISALKKTAVVPLMWETWEHRSLDFDLEYCKKRNILVLGTHEQYPPCDMRRFVCLASLKLLFSLGFDGGQILLLGNGELPARSIVNNLRKLGINVTWVSSDKDSDVQYKEFREYYLSHGHKYDVALIAEHRMQDLILGEGGIIDYETIQLINPELKVGVMCGNVDAAGLKQSGILFEPQEIAAIGFISYQLYMIGHRPVLTLYAAGLKVGETMARARLSGMSLAESVRYAKENSLAMDFEEDNSWT